MDITRMVLAALDRQPGGVWDVLPSLYTAPQPVCGEYPTAGAAHAALIQAGFEPTARPVIAPPLVPGHDPQSVLRYSAGEGRDVLLARRRVDAAEVPL